MKWLRVVPITDPQSLISNLQLKQIIHVVSTWRHTTMLFHINLNQLSFLSGIHGIFFINKILNIPVHIQLFLKTFPEVDNAYNVIDLLIFIIKSKDTFKLRDCVDGLEGLMAPRVSEYNSFSSSLVTKDGTPNAFAFRPPYLWYPAITA